MSDIFGKVDGIEPCKSLGSCGWTGCDDCATRVHIGPVSGSSYRQGRDKRGVGYDQDVLLDMGNNGLADSNGNRADANAWLYGWDVLCCELLIADSIDQFDIFG